jgi:hypothetical protein
MYEPLVILHSWIRWIVLLAGLFALVRAIRGKAGRAAWGPGDEAAGRWFVTSVDIQMLIGLVLYLFLSPYTMSAWSNMGEAMRDPMLRFFAIEHLVGMIGGTALAHVGRVRIRKASEPLRKHTLAIIFFTLALLLIAGSIPWPFMSTGRPLIRMF